MIPLQEWHDRIIEDLDKALDKSEPLPWRLWRPTPAADSALTALAGRFPDHVRDIREAVDRLGTFEDDLQIADGASLLRRRIADLMTAAADMERSELRKRMTKADAEQIAKEKFDDLWRTDNRSEWSRQIGCNRKMVPDLKAWQDAERRRKGWRKVETRLKGIVDPKIIEALHTSDASVLGSLSEADRERLDGMSDSDRADLIELLSEQARDAIS